MPNSEGFQLAPAPGATLAIVGGCGGIGRAVTKAALSVGAHVVVLDMAVSLAKHPVPAPATGIAFDATDPDDVTRSFDQIGKLFDGKLSGLINLAGFANRHVPVDQLSNAEWDETINGNLKSTYLTCVAALPLLRAGAADGTVSSAIVNVASGLGVRLFAGFGPYGAAKAGVIALTKSLAIECGPNVRANAVAPGPVNTEFLTGGTGRTQTELHVDKAAYGRMVPMARIGEPDDIVGPILFLLGPGARFMTGQTLHVNGGSLMP